MDNQQEHLNALQDIRQMMQRSNRFISLSGWSGISAGVCALVGAFFAYNTMHRQGYYTTHGYSGKAIRGEYSLVSLINEPLVIIAAFTFVAAFFLAFLFTYIRSKKQNIPIWGITARRLLFNVSVPMLVGGMFILRLIQYNVEGLVAPASLIFYGLALINASKYTLNEIRNLGYAQVVLGIINCYAIGYGLFFWAIGFGVLHIFYGVFMWWKYERTDAIEK
ncbi:MAG: hypothetical protein JWQ96_1386 [Segetibacter sp.]|nr:hypothetical protein [Segetibacter sp.]